jgi:hypothetical protein
MRRCRFRRKARFDNGANRHVLRTDLDEISDKANAFGVVELDEGDHIGRLKIG